MTFEGTLTEKIVTHRDEVFVDFDYIFTLSTGETREVQIDWEEDQTAYYESSGI